MKLLSLHEKMLMKRKLDIMIAAELPRLDANPPPPTPKVPRVGSSAAKGQPSKEVTDSYFSDNEIGTGEDGGSMAETSAHAETQRARDERRSTKRCNDVRNWQAGKLRNCTPHRIHDDIEKATVRNLSEVGAKMQ